MDQCSMINNSQVSVMRTVIQVEMKANGWILQRQCCCIWIEIAMENPWAFKYWKTIKLRHKDGRQWKVNSGHWWLWCLGSSGRNAMLIKWLLRKMDWPWQGRCEGKVKKNHRVKVSDPTGLRRLFRFSLRVHSLFYSDVLFIALTQEQMDAIPTKVLSCELLASCSRRESR